MKHFDLDEEEKELLATYEAGLFKPAKNSAELKEKFQLAAKSTLAKTRVCKKQI